MIKTYADRKGWRGRIIRYAPIFLWTGVIFYLSSSQGSMSETSRLIGPMLKFLFPSVSPETLSLFHGFIRKSAHVIEYAILAFLAVRALSRSSIVPLLRYRFILSLVIVAVVAALDELNQSLNTTRNGSVWDVLLDISGGLAAVAVSWLLGWPKQSVPAELPLDGSK